MVIEGTGWAGNQGDMYMGGMVIEGTGWLETKEVCGV